MLSSKNRKKTMSIMANDDSNKSKSNRNLGCNRLYNLNEKILHLTAEVYFLIKT